ncbi:MAG: N-acetylmuramoyl-L-alanine amidase [Synergistaceae bacterium]|nr:N-acetylmuramoyl-L-alanine amidase [Synergistaceae bacterium]
MFLFVSAFLSAVPAEARVGTLYKGSTPLGPVPVMDGKEGLVVSIADAGALLGLNASVVGEELLLSHGTGKLKIVVDAVAAWYNTQLVPLYGASYVQDGKWWLDVPSSVSLLQRFAGRGNGDRLRVEDVGPAPGEESAVPKEPPKTKIPLTVPQKTDSQPPASRVVVVSEPVQTPPPAEVRPVPAPSPTQPAAVQAPGEIRAIRWSTSREKIRMVVDCSEGTNPEIKVVPGKISMMFTKAADDLQGIPSPYDNVKAELVQNSKDSATLALSTATAGIRVEKLILDNPRRIVLDFILTSPADIQKTASGEQAPPPIGVPADTGQIVREAPKKSGKLLVVLDPGHGGKDPGAVGNGFREKDINLAIGLKMERSLKNKGFDVKMTRNTDIYLKLQERTDIANKANADMFVSIHVNALPPGKNSSGFEIYLMALPTDKDALALAKIENREYVEDKSANGEASDRKTELLLKILGDMQQNNKINESTVVAEALFKAGNSQGIPMKRVRQAPFFVLRGAGMPAVLLETGFITNANEAKLLAHAGYQQKIADAMVDGIRNYFKE